MPRPVPRAKHVLRLHLLVVGSFALALGAPHAGAGAAGGRPGRAEVTDPTYAALRAARPDGRVVPVHGLVLERDAFRFQFDDGAFHLLAPVAGRTVGAVFLGHGSLRLTPSTPAETRQLALYLGAGQDFEFLADTFEELVLFFTDNTARELGETPSPAAPGTPGTPGTPADSVRQEQPVPAARRAPDPRAVEVYEHWFERQRKDLRLNLQVRLLEDLLNSPPRPPGVFLALLKGKKLPPALAAVDPAGLDELGIGIRSGGEGTALVVPDLNRGGIWYLSHRRGEPEEKRTGEPLAAAEPIHYAVETHVERNADLAGLTTARFRVLAPGLRVLPLHLMERLRIGKVAFRLEPVPPPGASAPPQAPAQEAPETPETPENNEASGWRPAAVIQEPAKEDSEPAVVFPEPLAGGATVLLRIAYEGDSVLADEGDKNFAVGARESWYANLGVFSTPATFDLVYHVPEGSEIVSVGREVAARSEGKQSVSTWKADLPIEVAGFNYGHFKKLAKQDEPTGVELAVYTNPGTPDFIRGLENIEVPGFGRVNTSHLADSALVDGLNAARIYTAYFGPLRDKHVAITQQSQFSFGQSWPSLIFLPYMAFLDSSQRHALGMSFSAKYFVDSVGFHEFAHQWWGHTITANSYRDVWLEEGFSEFSAALAIQLTQSWAAYDDFWSRARKRITDKPPGNTMPCFEAGPISQGLRLATSRTPSAYQAMIYEKGGYVLHMLRMLMRNNDPKAGDEHFIAMMKDFASTYAGKRASTADFQAVVERHMLPAMNAAGDGKMDWFFRQWVYGTELPPIWRRPQDRERRRAMASHRQDLTGKGCEGLPGAGPHLSRIRQGADRPGGPGAPHRPDHRSGRRHPQAAQEAQARGDQCPWRRPVTRLDLDRPTRLRTGRGSHRNKMRSARYL